MIITMNFLTPGKESPSATKKERKFGCFRLSVLISLKNTIKTLFRVGADSRPCGILGDEDVHNGFIISMLTLSEI